MLKLTVSRPNSIGTYITKEFDSYNDAETYIETRVEKLADSNWECTELEGSNSKCGTIECVHDDQADAIVIEWDTVAD